MNKYYDDIITGLNEVLKIEKGEIPMKEVDGMPAKILRIDRDTKEVSREEE